MADQYRVPSGDPKRDAKAQVKADKAYKKASRPWFKKKRFILPLILLVLFGIGAAMGGGGNDDPAQTGAPEETTAPAPETEAAGEPTEEPAPEAAFPGAQADDVIGDAGEELTLGDVAVTSAPLAAGDATFGETLCTAVRVANNSSDTIDFNAFDWKLQAPGGTIATTSLTGSDNVISAGQIAPGGTTEGDVCFDAKNADEGRYVVLYEPIFSFFSDRAAWINK